ncbi:hypothetical protein TNIN_324941 [Trichonephila inaurata madagascariensis]|uniref:Uncharacterized protein n=1 Tax=Trichonephila inaurata madagascariensis TaxID=2747483 RepID=A0A8X6XS16_9ARAC|nr:hypothetical protein TNIN_324941 [Trichonephila inaurata madagascariensis]
MYDSGDIVTIWQLVNVAQDDNPTDEQVLRRPEDLCAWTIWRVACSTQLANDFLRFERRDSESISNLSPSFKNCFPYLFRMSFKSSRYERSCRQPAILSRKRKAEKEILLSVSFLIAQHSAIDWNPLERNFICKCLCVCEQRSIIQDVFGDSLIIPKGLKCIC